MGETQSNPSLIYQCDHYCFPRHGNVLLFPGIVTGEAGGGTDKDHAEEGDVGPGHDQRYRLPLRLRQQQMEILILTLVLVLNAVLPTYCSPICTSLDFRGGCYCLFQRLSMV